MLAACAIVSMITTTSALLMTTRVSATATAATATAAAAAAAATTRVIVAVSCGFGAVAAALVRLHAPADGLGRHTSADLDVGLLDTHPRLNIASSTSSVGGRQHPLSVGVGEFVNRNHTDACRVVATISGAETNAPSCLLFVPLAFIATNVAGETYSERHLEVSAVFRALLGSHRILASKHLDKGMAFVLVHDTSLHGAVATEDGAQFSFRATAYLLAQHSRGPGGLCQLTLLLPRRGFGSAL